MKNKELVDEMAIHSRFDREQIPVLLNAATNALRSIILSGKNIDIQNFGTFNHVKHPEKTVTDADTNVRTIFPPKLEVEFSQSDNFWK